MNIEYNHKSKSISCLLMIAVAVTAAALRLIGLGSSSLTLNEAESAMAALDLFGKGSVNLLYGLPTALIFKFFGDSEFSARLFPAMTGTLLALLPLVLRDRYGRRKMLLLSMLLAVDPVLLFWSKRADALIPAILMAAAAAVLSLKGMPHGALFFFLCALSGGDRCIPGLLILTAALVILSVVGQFDPGNFMETVPSKRRALTAFLLFILCMTAFGFFPAGFSLFGNGIADSFRPTPAWVYPGIAAVIMAVFVYLGIPMMFFLYRNIRRKNLLLIAGFLMGSVCLILWRGVLAFPWMAVILDLAAAEVLDEISASLKMQRGFPFYTAAAATVGAFGFFWFRLVEMFTQRNGSDPIIITMNGTDQTLPFNRFTGSVLLTLLSLVILGLVLKILLGLFESDQVKKGILCGFLVLCVWGLAANIWNAGGFDREGDHPAAPHLKNTANVLNGACTSLSGSVLFDVIDQTVLKHGDTAKTVFGLNLIQDDLLMDWKLRKIDGIQKTANPHSNLTGIDMILDPNGNSYAEYGYVGSVISWRCTVDWTKFSFQDWGKWLIFGDAAMIQDPPVTLWVPGNYIYLAED